MARPLDASYDFPVARKQVIVQLDDGLLADLDFFAKALRISRSELLRRAARFYLEAMDETIADQRRIDSYTRHPERPEDWALGYDAEPVRDLR